MLGVGSIVSDSWGNIFGQDPYGNGVSGDRILKITPSGSVSSFSVPPAMSTCTVNQLAIDGSDQLYLYDITSGYILRFSTNGTYLQFIDLRSFGGGGSCSDTSVIGLVSSPDGTLFAGSPKRSTIYRISPTGIISSLAAVANPYKLDLDGTGGVFAISDGLILHVSNTGIVSNFYDPRNTIGPATTLRRDQNGDIYFYAANTIHKLDHSGTTLTPVAACLPSVTDITFGPSTTINRPHSLYFSHIGTSIAAFDGDKIYEIQR
jgi:hypothetical protein